MDIPGYVLNPSHETKTYWAVFFEIQGDPITDDDDDDDDDDD